MSNDENLGQTVVNTGTQDLSNPQGVGGYRQSSGYVFDEFLPDLRGMRGRKKYREMADSDPIIGAMIYGITSIIRAASWTAQSAEGDSAGFYSKWLEDTLFNMPKMTWDNIIEDALSMMVYGFAVQEIVICKKEDGSIGLSGLFPRSQETIEKWDTDRNGNVFGVWQTPIDNAQTVYLPLSKLVHYKTTYARGNPEGRSMLRNAYKSYHFIKTTEISEAIGAERDLTGLPVLSAPSAYLAISGNRAKLEAIGRDIRLNDQGSVVLPSDTFNDGTGSPSAIKQFELKLLSAEGSSGKVDTDKIIKRHSANMGRTLLADFLMLGTDGKSGSYSLSANKTDMFIRAVEGTLENIAQTLDRQLTPLLWNLNNFPPEMMPKLQAGRIAPIDLQILGDFVSKLSGAGIPLNDEATEDYLREVSGLPETPSDAERKDDESDDEENDKEEAALEKFLNRETVTPEEIQDMIEKARLANPAPAPVIKIENNIPSNNVAPAPAPSVVNVTLPEMTYNAPDINISNNMPEQKAGDIQINVPEQKQGDIKINMPDVKVNVESPSINIDANINPSEVKLSLPARKTETSVQYDKFGNIKSTTQTEKDA